MAIGLNLQYRKFINKDISYGASVYGEIIRGRNRLDSETCHDLTSFYFSCNLFATYKDWSLTLSANSKLKTLYGEMVSTKGEYSNLAVSYKWKSFNFALMASWIATPYGDYSRQESLSSIKPSRTLNVIKDNANTLGFSITYRLNFGRQVNLNDKRDNRTSINKKAVSLPE